MPLLRHRVSLLLLGSLLFSLDIPANAQTTAQANAAIDNEATVHIERTTHPLATAANEIGRVEANKNLQRMILLLSPSVEAEQALKKLLDDQQNPNSPRYHQWLTAAEFGARFGVADTDVQKVSEWLASNGLTVGQVARSKRWLEFSGTAQQVESAFHTQLNYYRVGGNRYLANSSDVALPQAVAGVSRGVLSLNSFGRNPPRLLQGGIAGRDSQGQKVRLQPNLTAVGATNTYYLAPGDFAAIYNTKPLLSAGMDGTGVSIAVIAQSQIELTDVQMFRQIFGLKANDPNILVSGPDPGFPNPVDAQEAQLDVEWAGAVAPGATVNLVVAGSTDTTNGVDLAAAYAIDNEVAPILTFTYGSCEAALGTSGNAFYNALWQQAAAEGITVLVASGDNGAAGCDNASGGLPATHGLAVNGAASTPYNVAVGGTQFSDSGTEATYWNSNNSSDYSSAKGYIPEAAWNESCDPGQAPGPTNCAFGGANLSLLASAGGASAVYAKPSWQSGTGVPGDGARDVPDVALAAASGHDDFVFCTSLGGTPCQIDSLQNVVGLTLVGGTSASTPAMAGILALIEQKNGAFQGQANYVLYRLAQAAGNSCDSSQQTNPTAQNACVFYDITSGNNSVPCTGGSIGCSSTDSSKNGILSGAVAGAGYDATIGLGSVNATNLANAWKDLMLAGTQTTLQISAAIFAHGTPITLTGTVTPAGGNGSPTGDVSLKTASYGDAPDVLTLTNGGSFAGSVSDLPGGQYNLRAHYAGNAVFASSDSAVLALTVSPEASATTISANGLQGGTVAYGDPLAVVVKVAGASGAGRATGTITLLDGAATVGTYGLTADGAVSIPTGAGSGYAFSIGAHSLTASYAGDNSFTASTSGALAFNVTKGIPAVVVGLNTATVTTGQPVGAHVVVSGSGTAAATGSVQFTVDGVPVGTPLALQTGGFFGNQAQASVLLTNLAAGTHTIAASYDGSNDPNYSSVGITDPTDFAQQLQVITSTGTKTTTTLTAPSAANLGDTVTFIATVTPTSATGTVTLWDAVGPRSIAAAISNGSVQVNIPWTQAGNTALYAVYSGDATNAASASATSPFTVKQGVPQVILIAQASANATQEVSLNISVVGDPKNSQLLAPSGVVELWDSLNGGSATLLTAQRLTAGAGNIAVYGSRLTFSPGKHSIHAHYRGDNNWQAADSASTPLVSSDFTITVQPQIPITAGSPGSATVTITPIGGFSGVVNFTCPTGGTATPVGYACSIASVTIPANSTAAANTTLNLTVTTIAAAVKTAGTSGGGSGLWGLGFVAGSLLLAMVAIGAIRRKPAREFAFASGCVLCVASVVMGCGGGGGGGGGGPVATTTTLMSTNLRAGFGTPVTFNVNVTSSANAAGKVQLFDNGQVLGSQVPVNAGMASFLTTNLPIGLHVITASYLGDVNTLPSSSAPINQAITGSIPLQFTATSDSGITHTSGEIIVVVN